MKQLSILILSVLSLSFLFLNCGPANYQLQFRQIDEKLNEKKLAEAENLCREIIKNDSQNSEAYLYLGKILLEKNDLTDAFTNFKKSRSLKKSPDVIFQLANINCKLGNLTTAKAYLDSLGGVSQGQNEYSKLLGDILSAKASADSAYDAGIEFYSADKYYSALMSFKCSGELNKENRENEYYRNMAEGLYLYYKKGVDSYWDAIIAFGKAAVLKPEQGEPHYLMGICYEKKDKDDFDNTISEYRKALELEMTDDYREKAASRLKNQTERKKKLDAFWGR